jgi:DNA-binding transcriptional LysR family regulator
MQSLRCFKTVAEERHFARAAEKLYLSQPTVSKAIQRLERSIGKKLFDRSTSPVVLTPTGEELYVAVSDALARLDQAYAAISQTHGTFRIGYSPDLGPTLIAEAIAVAHQRFPELRIQWAARRSPEQVEALRSGALDIGIGWGPDMENDFSNLVLGHTGFAVLVRQDHALASRAAVALHDLRSETIIMWQGSRNPGVSSAVVTTLHRAGINSILEAFEGVDDIASQVIERHGVGLVSSGYARERQVPGTRWLPVLAPVPDMPLVMAWVQASERPGFDSVTALLRSVSAEAELQWPAEVATAELVR